MVTHGFRRDPSAVRFVTIVVLALSLTGAGCRSKSAAPDAKPPAPAPRPGLVPPGPDDIWEFDSKTKYGHIKKFMSYEDVVKLMGSDGERVPLDDGSNDRIYEWVDVDGMKTRVVFRGGKAIARAHDLKPRSG